MTKPQNEKTSLDLDFRIGLGWWLDNQDLDYAGRVVSHHGGFPPYCSHVLLALDNKLGVVVLSNSTPGGDAVERIAIATLKWAIEAKTGIRPPDGATADKRAIPGRRVDDFAGSYNTLIGMVPVRRSGTQWQCEMKGHTVFLLPNTDGACVPQYRLLRLFPIEIEELRALRFGFTEVNGHQLMAVQRYGRWLPMGEKGKAVPISTAWRGRLGQFRLTVSEPGTAIGQDARLGIRDDLLVFSYVLMPPFAAREHAELALLPVSDDEAVFADGGIVGGETVRVTRQGGVERLRLFGYEMKRVDAHTK